MDLQLGHFSIQAWTPIKVHQLPKSLLSTNAITMNVGTSCATAEDDGNIHDGGGEELSNEIADLLDEIEIELNGSSLNAAAATNEGTYDASIMDTEYGDMKKQN